MSSNEIVTYMDSPSFHEAMGHFQVGRWEEGFLKLGEVEKDFPLEANLRALHQEIEVRSHISGYEIEENKHLKRHNLVKYGLQLLMVLLIISGAIYGALTYSGWIRGEWAKTQASIAQSWKQAQLGIEFHNAQQLMIAGKPEEALSAYDAIKSQNPDFPGLAESIVQAQTLKDVEVQYTQAMNLLQIGDSAQALDLLKQISEKMPDYRDVSFQIKSLQTHAEMTSVFEKAELAYSEGRYEDAITNLESLRIMDPTFQVSIVEKDLFQSYIKAAQELLLSPVPTTEILKKADDYFSRALAIKPLDRDALAARTQVRMVIEDGIINDYVNQAQAALASAPDSLDAQKAAEHYLSLALGVRPNDSNVLLQFQLAQTFVQAISDFTSSKWDSVIEQLEFVITQEAGYASGTALQTLYDAYIARGSDYIASGEYALALQDFQRSAVLAKQLPDSDPLSFEAQVMIGEAQGSLNHFQQAVQIYQDALNMIGLRDRIVALKNSLTDSLTYADYLANAGDYQSAFYAYQKLIGNRVKAYDQSVVVTVKNGDYLTLLAHRYHTTVAAILSANNMNNQPRLTPNTPLIIPTLP
jgi:tetratricopeptide (TPR) repeat protein